MSLSRPNARLTVDGQTLSADEAALVRLRVDLVADGRHDHAELQLWPHSRLADAAPGATLAIELGERDRETLVFTGELNARRQQPDAIVLEALAATAALNKYFDPASRRTQNAATMLQQAQQHMKGAELPRLDETLSALATAAAGR